MNDILNFLEEFSSLTKKHQAVFLFCLKKCPFPRPYTGDLKIIELATGSQRNTVRAALREISRRKSLKHLVAYSRIKPMEEIFYEQQQRQQENTIKISEDDHTTAYGEDPQ